MNAWDWFVVFGIVVAITLFLGMAVSFIALISSDPARWWSRGTHQGRYRRKDD